MASTIVTSSALALGCVSLAARSHIPRICHILVSRRPRLSFAPSRLTSIDVVFILLAVAFKSILNLLGLVPKLELWPEEQKFTLPAIGITAPVEIKDADVQRYREALAAVQAEPKRDREEQKSSMLLLAGLTTPLMLLTLANYHSPILPLGSVNTKNRFEYLVSDLTAYIGKEMLAAASFGGPQQSGRQTRHGIEFDIVIEVTSIDTSGDQAASTAIFRQYITIMQKLPRKLRLVASKPNEPATRLVDHSIPVHSENVKVPFAAPRAWARLCKDYNPIHISAVAARLFGFPGKIAHGNHLVCVALNAIEPELHARNATVEAVEVVFKRPMVLPTTMTLSHQTAVGGKQLLFEVHRGEKTHIEGTVTLA